MKKIMAAFILGAGVCSVQALTPVGGDDFDDNTVNPSRVPLFTDPGVAFTETNQRLEFSDAPDFMLCGKMEVPLRTGLNPVSDWLRKLMPSRE